MKNQTSFISESLAKSIDKMIRRHIAQCDEDDRVDYLKRWKISVARDINSRLSPMDQGIEVYFQIKENIDRLISNQEFNCYRHLKRINEQCYDCSSPAAYGYTRCLKHLESGRKAREKYMYSRL